MFQKSSLSVELSPVSYSYLITACANHTLLQQIEQWLHGQKNGLFLSNLIKTMVHVRWFFLRFTIDYVLCCVNMHTVKTTNVFDCRFLYSFFKNISTMCCAGIYKSVQRECEWNKVTRYLKDYKFMSALDDKT